MTAAIRHPVVLAALAAAFLFGASTPLAMLIDYPHIHHTHGH
jgi:hypothetical protein